MDLVRTQKPLLTTAALMCALALFALAAMAFDDRVLLGVSVWTKPLKFAVAFALYSITLAWLLAHPHRGSRWTRRLATVFAATAVIDVGFIVAQAARGTFSHFNEADDPVNAIGQIVFASGVPGLFFANLAIAGILVWQRVGDRATTLAIRAGLVLSVVGMALGYLVGFAGAQVQPDAAGHLVELNARHTFGAPDGGPMIPIVGWSSTAGDLRIPHFLGLHGMQVLLLVAFALSVASARRPALRADRARSVIVGAVAVAYAATLAITLWQALRGQSLVHPDLSTVLAAVVAAAVSIGGLVWFWPVTSPPVAALDAQSGSDPQPVR